MPKFGKRSKERLATCDERLQKVFNEVINYVDCSVLEGHRGEREQNKYFAEGKSKVQYPLGRHNANPSRAVDVVPYPIDWNDRERFHLFAGFVLGIAYSMIYLYVGEEIGIKTLKLMIIILMTFLTLN